MKNIFLKETDQKSKLYRNLLTDKLFILEGKVTDVSECNREYHFIYVTNDEEIKEGVYGIINGQVGKIIITHDGYEFQINKNVSHLYGDFYSLKDVCKKIVLTNNPTLIEDGVQAIDDEFLEWFVKNPSCEEVKVYKSGCHYDGAMEFYIDVFYSVITPKENKEQSSKTEENIIDQWLEKNGNPEIMKQVEREAEELELEIEAQKLYPIKDINWTLKPQKDAFIKGAKWQKSRMYTEEEVIALIHRFNYDLVNSNIETFKEWFDEHKKQ